MEDFLFPYEKLDPGNDWVRLAALVPWDVAEERYAAQFLNNGRPAHPARMALGALLIQRRLKCGGQWLVKHLGENPYLQYFIKRARKDYLRLSKSKKRSAKAIRSAVRKQPQYSIPRRIVSLVQPWVRPIVRGKAHANAGFGPKLHISLVDGCARIERLDFEPFNESQDLRQAAARHRERYGCYPERILADKIYRNRQTLAFCKEHGNLQAFEAFPRPVHNKSTHTAPRHI